MYDKDYVEKYIDEGVYPWLDLLEIFHDQYEMKMETIEHYARGMGHIVVRDGLLREMVQEPSRPDDFIKWWNLNVNSFTKLNVENKINALTVLAGVLLIKNELDAWNQCVNHAFKLCDSIGAHHPSLLLTMWHGMRKAAELGKEREISGVFIESLNKTTADQIIDMYNQHKQNIGGQ